MPRKLIIDTDPGVDDVLAILLALASPEIDLKLLSICFGNTHAASAHLNTLKIYYMLQRELAAIPDARKRYGGYVKGRTVLAVGEDEPIGGEKAVAAYFHGKDGLSNLADLHPEYTPKELLEGEEHEMLTLDTRKSWQVMLEILEQEEEGSVTIVALGPLTNIAQALRANPKVFARVGGLVWMGGVLDRPGNTSPVAEFNCFADPYAADAVLQANKSGLFPLVMAPLDITTPHDVPFTDLIHPSIIRKAAEKTASAAETAAKPVADEITDEAAPTPPEEFIGNMLLRVRGLQASFGLPDAMEMHDPVAVWYAVQNAPLPLIGTTLSSSGTESEQNGFYLQQRDFKIERCGELTRGMCVVDRRGTGEESGDADRTKSELGKGGDPVDKKQNGAMPKPDPTTDRMGNKVVKAKDLPWVIVKTPGKDVLRKVLLERVFGRSV